MEPHRTPGFPLYVNFSAPWSWIFLSIAGNNAMHILMHNQMGIVSFNLNKSVHLLSITITGMCICMCAARYVDVAQEHVAKCRCCENEDHPSLIMCPSPLKLLASLSRKEVMHMALNRSFSLTKSKWWDRRGQNNCPHHLNYNICLGNRS